MKNLKFIFILSIIFLCFSSCKKNGTGGDAELRIQVLHHNSAIKNAFAYIRFDAIEMPANPESNYDLKIQGNSSDEYIEVKDLRAGQYYVYVVGFDSTINQTVKGGIPVEIKWKERKNKLNVLVPVTE